MLSVNIECDDLIASLYGMGSTTPGAHAIFSGLLRFSMIANRTVRHYFSTQCHIETARNEICSGNGGLLAWGYVVGCSRRTEWFILALDVRFLIAVEGACLSKMRFEVKLGQRDLRMIGDLRCYDGFTTSCGFADGGLGSIVHSLTFSLS